MGQVNLEDHFFNPRNVGEIAGPGFNGQAASVSCGGVLRISIEVDESQSISDIKFKAAGCSTLVAAASSLTEMVKGKTTAEAAALAREAVMLISSSLNGDTRD